MSTKLIVLLITVVICNAYTCYNSTYQPENPCQPNGGSIIQLCEDGCEQFKRPVDGVERCTNVTVSEPERKLLMPYICGREHEYRFGQYKCSTGGDLLISYLPACYLSDYECNVDGYGTICSPGCINQNNTCTLITLTNGRNCSGYSIHITHISECEEYTEPKCPTHCVYSQPRGLCLPNATAEEIQNRGLCNNKPWNGWFCEPFVYLRCPFTNLTITAVYNITTKNIPSCYQNFVNSISDICIISVYEGYAQRPYVPYSYDYIAYPARLAYKYDDIYCNYSYTSTGGMFCAKKYKICCA
ncbi:hypothetical protein KDA11_06520 [Candidatus Saccharibacteria bacterium]|nr:hypothetical protein [Candidatus Saccharibacteria bacterium]